MKELLILAAITGLLLFYALFLRDWLRSKPWAEAFFEWIEPVEIFLFKKSPTILFARLKVFTGVALSFLASIGDIDLTPIAPFVPEKYQSWVYGAINALPLLISLIGWADERLRYKTTLPIDLVSVKEATAPPEVKVAIAVAQEAKDQAVAVVKDAKAA